MPESSNAGEVTRVTHTESVTRTVTDSTETRRRAAEPEKPSHPYRQKSPRRKVLIEILWAGLFCLIFAGLASWFDQTSVGEQFSWFTYYVLQGRLGDANEAKDVTLVDIGGLPPDAASEVTSRKDLHELIEAIAKENPKTIGVDIDFSPDHGKLVDPQEDIGFFDFCKGFCDRKPAALPIYLGIYRSQAQPPSRWLGFPLYQKMAAALLVRTSPDRSLWSVSPAAAEGKPAKEKLPKAPTMSAALAAAFEPTEQTGWRHFFSRFLPEKVEDVVLDAFYIDYSARTHLSHNAITIGKRDLSDGSLPGILRSRRKDIEGKAILIGDVSNAKQGDLFPDPEPGRAPIPGVVVHASATDTLIAAPLYALPEINKFLLDFLFSLVVLAAIFTIRLIYLEKVNEEKLTLVANFGMAALVLLFGWSVNFTRVLWPDFLLLAIGLVLHPAAHRRFELLKTKFFHWIQAREVKSE